MVNAFSIAPGRVTGDERVPEMARWLANQSAMPTTMTERTAWRIIEQARKGLLEVKGPRAPLIVQARFSLWMVGQLGGRPLMRVFADETAATDTARELGNQMKVPVLVIGGGGEIAERFDSQALGLAPVRTVAPASVPMLASTEARALPSEVVPARPRLPTLKVARHGDRWAVFVEGRVVATAPTRDRARQRARVLKDDPDFIVDPSSVVDERV